MSEATGPLKGVKILDLTRLLPGPLATQYMADLGADVIKIEDVKHPDYTRFFPPQIGGQSVHFLAINRSKKSLALQLGSEAGKAVFFDLIKEADIVIEGFRPGWMEKMMLDYNRARAINKRIIYVSLTGYGLKGPLSSKAGHDLNYVGYTGLISVNGKNGEMVMPGVQIADIMGGSYNAIIACLSALLEKNQTDEGQKVTVSMTDGALQMMSMPLGEYLNTGHSYGPGEFMLSGGLANYNIYKCKDEKYVALGSLEPKFWMAFCQMAGHPEWMGEALPIPEKVVKLKEELETFFMTKTRDEWINDSEAYDVCLSPILGLDEVESHAHFKASEMFIEMEHPVYGKIKSIAQPLKFSRTQLHKGWPAPLLGEHSVDVLKNIGYSSGKIQAFLSTNVIKQASL